MLQTTNQRRAGQGVAFATIFVLFRPVFSRRGYSISRGMVDPSRGAAAVPKSEQEGWK